ncbi:MAG: hypothetical protein HND56_12365 [Pseudomonadota bacterium]|jgi:hypothetical protein|nr:hypothetical protein [Pseudomonadota bacterium]QKK06427.1 MAG: hypothetical protein HND56_12365 [Pseudomonadota bacterium]
MGLLYVVCGFFVVVMMAALPVLPFVKVWLRLRKHHRDLWNGMGPFDIMDLVTSGGAQYNFLRIIQKAHEQEKLVERDPELIKWTNVCNELIKAFPKTFMSQIILFFVLFFIASSFTAGLVSLFS